VAKNDDKKPNDQAPEPRPYDNGSTATHSDDGNGAEYRGVDTDNE